MPGKQRYAKAQVMDALRASKGMVSVAAQRLGCDVDTVANYCKRFSDVEAVKQESRIEILDEAELRLWQAIRRDESWAIAFALRTIGRDRGYGEQVALHVQIERVASHVAAQVGLTSADVLAEATRILGEIDYGTS
jgi:hypothetical protein